MNTKSLYTTFDDLSAVRFLFRLAWLLVKLERDNVALLDEFIPVADDVAGPAGLTDVELAGIRNEGNLLLSSMLTEFEVG